jgi:nitroimidazol reductase NimA-like FMN-containing flavoprotein (pyridoxamine 5'-phosphate oxidase superfamily)
MIIEEMSKSDCLRTLADARFGRLGCARENQPYVVPIYFAFRDPYLYSFTTLGQKVQWMRANPLVCVELDEVDDCDKWTSIVIFGRYQELPDNPEWNQERLRAHTLLQEHIGWWEPGCAGRAQLSPKQELEPVFFRIHIRDVTGRRAKPDRAISGVFTSGTGRSWFQKWCRALSGVLTERRKIR